MRLFLLPLLLFTTVTLFSQSPFQGKVVYNLHTPREKNDAVLTAYFGPQRLRLEFTEKGKEPDNDVIIVSLDSGLVMHLKIGAETYTRKPLAKRDLTNYKSKQILGHKTSPRANPVSFGDGMTELFNQTVFYAADDLFYPVPEAYKGNSELMVVNSDRVVLGADIVFGPNVYKRELTASDSAEIEQNRITAEAIDMKVFEPADSLFEIPAGYTLEKPYDYSADSTAFYSDSLDFEDVKPASKKKKSKVSGKSISAQRTPANRRRKG